MSYLRALALAYIVLASACSSSLAAVTHKYEANTFGAVGDGKTLATAAIQKAIDQAAADGGGTISFQPGVYLIGSIFLKPHTHLQLDRGVTLLGTHDVGDYPIIPTRIEGIERPGLAALVNIIQADDTSISGPGTIDGDGPYWWDRSKRINSASASKRPGGSSRSVKLRPRLLLIYKSSRVHLGPGLLLRRSPFWTVHICYSNHVVVDGLTIRNNEGERGSSTDGVDIDSSSHVLVQHVDIENNDDAISFKAGRDADGLRVNRPTEDVVVRDSIIRVSKAAIAFGSETSGGFRNIEVYRIAETGDVNSGIAIKSARTRGGWSKNIYFHDIDMRGVRIPIHITMNWGDPKPVRSRLTGNAESNRTGALQLPPPNEKTLAHFRDWRISRIHATGAKQAFVVDGYPSAPLEDFRFHNVNISAATAGHINAARNWTFDNVHVTTKDGSKVVIAHSGRIHGSLEYR